MSKEFRIGGVVGADAGVTLTAYIMGSPMVTRKSGARETAGEAFQAAVKHQSAGRHPEAEAACRRVLAIRPDHADAVHRLGILAFLGGRLGEAAALIGRATGLDTTNADFRCNLGLALRAQGRLDDAASCYRLALLLRPDSVEAQSNLGNALRDQGLFDQAVGACRRSVLIQPARADAHMNFGLALAAGKSASPAVAAIRHAIAIMPHGADAYFNLANLLNDRNDLTGALVLYDRAIIIKPRFAEAHANRGNVFRERGQVREALAAYDEAIAANPKLVEGHSNKLMCLHYLSGVGSEEMFRAAVAFGAMVGRSTNAVRTARSATRLRIGYVSGDFRRHPVGYFLAGVLAAHDRSAFELVCYSNNAVSDDVTRQLRGAADHWRLIARMPDGEAASLIERDGIDILVDLSGHTAMNRLLLFARRAAPVQVSWLGYFGTTGLRQIDYILMDDASVPAGGDRWYAETVIRLPHGRFCYAPPAEAPVPIDPPAARHGSITFGSFNHVAKIGAEVVRLWAEVLRAVPRANLVLKWKSLEDSDVRARMRALFVAESIDPARLELRGPSPYRDMLAEYGDIDIALDPFPFGGGLTSCEALWMGVPVVTLPGERPASRQTLGFLELIGLPELAANSASAYVQIAANLAADPSRLVALRHSLRQRMAGSSLTDSRRFTRGLEFAFAEMARRRSAGLPVGPFPVRADL